MPWHWLGMWHYYHGLRGRRHGYRAKGQMCQCHGSSARADATNKATINFGYFKFMLYFPQI